MQYFGRIIALKQLKNATFFELRTYNDLEKKFEVLKCSIDLENCKNFQKLKSELFLGAYINCFDFIESLDKNNNYLLKCNNLTVYGSKNGPFPKRFKLNTLENKEILYRDRIFSLCTNEKYLEILNKKYRILNMVRNEFLTRNYQEVNIPVFETFFGGAEAKPFSVIANYNKKEYFLRTCFEFPLKGLLIIGFPKVFHIGSAFRNENLDRTHSPEFLFIEAYGINEQFDNLISLTEKLYRQAYFISNNSYENHGFDLRSPWPIYDAQFLESEIKRNNFKDLDELIDSKILGPFFHVKGYDCILAKNADHRIESYCDYTMELANFYQEENDYLRLLKKSENSENKVPEQFLKNLEYGMGPASGWGLGLDRLIMSATKADTLRDVQEYPIL